ncbi:hypothetical protein JGUZn3_00090 [Entomobacter blattae]|uniref:Uncharacterized protein n=1 Tax=Entomobacter blattae TaxID=2762277 RepID=A0A7H1NNB6_9PROT|nr:hypothetical protein JGUZn3_00090 [Entomobacter blattae]
MNDYLTTIGPVGNFHKSALMSRHSSDREPTMMETIIPFLFLVERRKPVENPKNITLFPVQILKQAH